MKRWYRRLDSLVRNIGRSSSSKKCSICWLRTAFWQQVPYEGYACVWVCCEECWPTLPKDERLTLAFNAYTKKCGLPPSGEHYQSLVQGIWQ